MDIVIATFVVSGAFGGVAGHFLYGGEWKRDLAKNIVLGVCAAFMVPLFLNTISSSLVREVIDGAGVVSVEYLVLVGFCLVASISAQKFIRLMSANLIKELEEVKATAQDASRKAETALGVTESSIEPETDSIDPEDQEAAKALDALTQKVLVHILNGPYTMRSATGLAKELSLDVKQVSDSLRILRELNFVGRGVNAYGKSRWYLTASGKKEALRLESREV